MTKKPLLETTQALSERFFNAANKQEKEGNQVLCEIYRRCQVFLDELTSIDGVDNIIAAYAIEKSDITEIVTGDSARNGVDEKKSDAVLMLYNIYDSLCLLVESDFGTGDARTMQLILAYLRTIREPLKDALDELTG